MNPYVKKILAVAAGEIGVRESNNNSGARVKEYQASTTLGGTHWPWCAAFISWIIQTALGKQFAADVWLNSASCDMILDWARRRGILSTKPAVGACGLVMASKNDATHIFIIESIKGNVMTTIEGNTNSGGSREGNGVYRRQRALSSRYLYVHFERLLPELPQDRPIWELWGKTKIADVDLQNGRVIVPAWKWATWFKMELGWNNAAQAVTLNGKEVPSQPMLIPDEHGVNRAWLGVRELAQATGFTIRVEPGKITLLR